MSYDNAHEDAGWELPVPATGQQGRPARALDEESCPKCGGRMWDNRLTKRNPNAPDFKCRDRSCDGVIWPEKKGKRDGGRAQGSPPQSLDYGDLPGMPAETGAPPQTAQGPSTAPIAPQRSNAEARAAFLKRHMACFEYVVEHYVPIIEGRNANASDVDATIQIDLKGIAALTYQILRGQEDAR